MQKVWAQIRQFAPATENVELDLVVSHKQAVVDYSSHLVLFAQVIYTPDSLVDPTGSRPISTRLLTALGTIKDFLSMYQAPDILVDTTLVVQELDS